MYGVAGDKATDLDQIGRFLFNFGNPILMYGVAGDKATDLDQIGRFLFNFGDPTIIRVLRAHAPSSPLSRFSCTYSYHSNVCMTSVFDEPF
jgi:hypothetical protein